MTKKIVAKVGKDITGKEKYEIMRKAVSQYNAAIKAGYFLEATTLMESLLANRLESRISELTKSDVEMNTLKLLCKQVKRSGEKDEIIIKILEEINKWANQRNEVIHEAAKISKGQKKKWENFLEDAEQTAKSGRKLFDAINKRLNQLRKK
ncbi:hypothetical protein [Daejeonia sp. YH14]|uniref:hypothetical protein n=1 Tax=Daejeonia sp. YH14 TaxID=3439042 RepID=UPI003F4996DB